MHWAWKLGMGGIDYKAERNSLAAVGSNAHYAVEADILGKPFDLDSVPMDEDERTLVRNCIEGWHAWKEMVHFSPCETESEYISETWRYGGRLDFGQHVGLAKDRYAITDVKTGKARESHLIQIAAYRNLWNEHHPDKPVDEAYLLMLGRDDGSFHWNYYPASVLEPCWEVFKALLVVHRYQKVIARAV